MLPADQRLLANRDFRVVYAKGRSYAHPITVLHVLRRTGDYAAVAPGRRIGFVVSKKQGGAVIRNRIKRRLRESVRRRLDLIKQGSIDLIFVGRKDAHKADWSELEAGIFDVLKRANLILAGETGERSRSDE